MQFWGRSEWALEFGDYEVNITVPSDHILEATGSLQNPKEVLNREEYKRFQASENSYDKPVIIVNQQEATAKESDFSQKKSTWKFYAENVQIEHPAEVYFKLNEITQAPFSCYISMPDFEVFCGSPERFIKKQSNKLISQPIKGTSKRGKSKQEDVGLKSILLNDPKERAENVMIVDLVRNDLSRIAKKNSVSVDELFGIYTFETVHQMISTISCEIEDSITFTDILKATFPMGSMTGAPKHSAMQLIEKHEDFQRGLYSGSIGYIAPNGDFDFNVVIRSLIYNTKNKYLSCPVGGAITIQSKPEAEYDECNTKVQSILQGMNA